MCGIVGIWGFEGCDRQDMLSCMLQTIKHRGPDDDGIWLCNNNSLGLGHVRLSIIDLTSAGHQPMAIEGDKLVIVFNGEIYNFPDLRARLEAEGVVFMSRSDTEVLLHGYRKWGKSIVKHINGIFAFAIWDGFRNELIVARDHFGVKPLYYTTEGGFAFASELKALLELPISRQVDETAILYHLTYLYSPSPTTMLKSVRKLDPGTLLVIRNGRIVERHEYYRPIYAEETASEFEWINRVRETIAASVKRQMIADVPVGAFLSGGLDSSSCVAFMVRSQVYNLGKFYTITWDKNENVEGCASDLYYARLIAKHLGISLEEIVIDSKIVDQLRRTIWHMDEPQADIAPINVSLISSAARANGMKVLIAGTGGDDVFTGYRTHVAARWERYWAWLPFPARAALRAAACALPIGLPALRRLRKLFAHAHLPPNRRIVSYWDWFEDEARNALLSPDLQSALTGKDAYEPLLEALRNLGNGFDPVTGLLRTGMRGFLPDHNLNYTDKLGMAHGVEIRVPLLDKEVVDLASRIPIRLKQRGSVGKWVFKKAMEGILPVEAIYRPKTGFGAPLRKWVTQDLRDMIRDTLTPERIIRRGWFSPAAVNRLIESNERRRIDASYIIWTLFSLETWAEIFLDNARP